MISSPASPRLSATYPTARIRGRLITRLEEQSLGWTVLDAATADEMCREHLGWFIGNHPGITNAIQQLGRLDANPEGGVWVVVPSSRALAHELFTNWPHPDHVSERPIENNSAWRSRKVWIAIPEDLKYHLPLARRLTPGIAGVILLDPCCIIYTARGGTDTWGRFHCNDRPQHVVNFRAALNADGWLPPLLVLTKRPAKAVTTSLVERALCLNGFRFIDGATFACSDAPIEPGSV
jgi:hypothetical protein